MQDEIAPGKEIALHLSRILRQAMRTEVFVQAPGRISALVALHRQEKATIGS